MARQTAGPTADECPAPIPVKADHDLVGERVRADRVGRSARHRNRTDIRSPVSGSEIMTSLPALICASMNS
jgi:hypothetical protein